MLTKIKLTFFFYTKRTNVIGINNCCFYDLRGNFATISLRNGCEIKDVAEVLGYKRIETTENYYIISSIDNFKKVCESIEKEIDIKIVD